MNIFPATTVSDMTSGILAVVTANIAVVLGVLAFTVGVRWVTKHFGKATRGRI